MSLWFKEKTAMKFDETEICDIAKFVLQFYFKDDETFKKVINEFRQEIRRKGAYPDFNVFGDKLCPRCRCNYYPEPYRYCLDCATKDRYARVDAALDAKDSSDS